MLLETFKHEHEVLEQNLCELGVVLVLPGLWGEWVQGVLFIIATALWLSVFGYVG